MPLRVARTTILAFAILVFLSVSVAAEPRVLTHGVSVGDVTSRTAVIWARGSAAGRLHVELRPESGRGPTRSAHQEIRADRDFTGKILMTGLRPGTRYRVSAELQQRRFLIWWGGPETRASFTTAPDDDEPAAARIAWGGDVAGQNVCRDAREGFPVFRAIRSTRPDLFIGLGDMIYADDPCEATGLYGNSQVAGDFGPSADLATFRAHWRYAREDPGFRDLLSETPYLGIWDDHEVVNDFGPLSDTRKKPPYRKGEHLLPLGLQAFLEYTPVPHGVLLYRKLRWGRHLEFFVLDTRRYRDANLAPDLPERPKTLLGPEQRRWLEEGLAESTATWKIVISSVPLSIPTGSDKRGRDGWASLGSDGGFENEIRGILETLRIAQVKNLVWLTTDVHFASVFRYTPFPEDPTFHFHEMVTGPLNAGIFPRHEFDSSLGPERLFFHGPESPQAVSAWEEALGWFNFGLLEVDGKGALGLKILDARGRELWSRVLTPHVVSHAHPRDKHPGAP